MDYKRIICCDFDGVVHWYRKGWQKGVIYDEPTPGAFDFLVGLVADERFEVAIYSSRSKEEGGIIAMQTWFYGRGLDSATLSALTFPTEKPAAFLTIDDRCFQFTGKFPTPEYLLAYTSWVSNSPSEGPLSHSDSSLLRSIAREGLSKNDDVGSEILRRIADRLEGIVR